MSPCSGADECLICARNPWRGIGYQAYAPHCNPQDPKGNARVRTPPAKLCRDTSYSVRRSPPLGRHPACRERARGTRGGERRRSASPAYGQALPRGPRPVALTIPGSRCGCVRRALSLWVFSTLGAEVCLNVDASAPSLGGLPEVTYRVPGQLIRTSWICCGQPAYTYLEASGFGARRALNFVIAWTQTPL